MEHELSPEKILQTGFAFWPAKVLLTAVELRLFTLLAQGPMTGSALTARLGLHGRGAADFLDSLVALGFLQREGESYANTPETGVFLDRDKPSYVGGILEMANRRLYDVWGRLAEGLRTGQPQNEHHGEDGLSPFDSLYADPERTADFLRAMTGISHGPNMLIARRFPWADYKTFVDVGTAQGDLAAQVALANPHLRGTGFDLAAAEPVFRDYIGRLGLAGRVDFRVGDFFAQSLPPADVVMMGHILHDWDLPTKKMLIAKAYAALPAGGALIVYESIIDNERRENAFGLMMSLNMLVETPGGFDYTGAECEAWMREAGFREARTEHLVGPESMVIGIK